MFPSPLSNSSTSNQSLAASDFEVRPAPEKPQVESPALAQAGGQKPAAMSMVQDVAPARAEDREPPDPVPTTASQAEGDTRCGEYLEWCGLATPNCVGAAGTIAFFASSPLLGCQICGYGLLAGGGLSTLVGGHDTVRGPQAQCMPDVRGRIQTTAGMSEAGLGLVALGIVGELGAASSSILPIAAGGTLICAGLTVGQMCCEA